jgi:hypothetical protein
VKVTRLYICMECSVKAKKKSIQRGSRNFLMNPRLYERIVPKIIKTFKSLKDDIVCDEEEILQVSI